MALLPLGRLVAEWPYDPIDPFAPLESVSRLLHRDDGTFHGSWIGYVTYEQGERLLGCAPRPLRTPYAVFFLHDRIAERTDGGWRGHSAGVRRSGIEADFDGWLARLPRPSPGPADPPSVRVVSDSLPAPAYRAAFDRIQGYIAAGDIYQANLTRMLTLDVGAAPHVYYDHLRAAHAAPFAAYLVEPDGAVTLGISPELFLRVEDGVVTTAPIKGTRPRGATPEEDAALRDALWSSEKDGAELLMIVDLMRNDLGRIAEVGSVRVPELKRLDTHPSLHHLSGVVTARLASGATVWDVLAHTLPAGSITGTPKRRAVEILESLEPHTRGVYTGTVGRIDVSGEATLNVGIRTVRTVRDRAFLGVGGGIVADPDGDAEFEEANDKARAFLFGRSPAPQETRS